MVAILGLLVAIAIPWVAGAIQRARLDTQAQEIRNFMLGAYTRAGEQRTPVTLRLEAPAAGARRMVIARNTDGTDELAALRLPQWLGLSTASVAGVTANWPQPAGVTDVYFLQCDPMGRALNPLTGNQVAAVQTLVVTHRNMVGGNLRPRIRYEVQVFPIWQVQARRGMW